jgi:hypothetical protein
MARNNLSTLMIAVVALLLLPVFYSVFSTGVSLAYLALPVLAVVSIGWFVWRIFFRVFLRATRISHIRERRLLREAAMR